MKSFLQSRVAIVAAVLAGSFSSFAFAAEEVAVPIRCRALCFERAGADDKLMASGTSPEAGVECPLPRTSPSAPFVCGALAGKIQFKDLAGQKVVATATVPAGVKNALLLFLPSGKETYQVMVLDDSDKGFPPGGAVICNLNSKDVRFTVGEHLRQIPPGKRVVLNRPEKRDDFNMAEVIFHAQQGEKWKKISETRLRFTPKGRYLILSYLEPKSKRPKLKTFRDSPAVELPPERP